MKEAGWHQLTESFCCLGCWQIPSARVNIRYKDLHILSISTVSSICLFPRFVFNFPNFLLPTPDLSASHLTRNRWVHSYFGPPLYTCKMNDKVRERSWWNGFWWRGNLGHLLTLFTCVPCSNSHAWSLTCYFHLMMGYYGAKLSLWLSRSNKTKLIMRSSSHMVTRYPLPVESSIIKVYDYTIQYDI